MAGPTHTINEDVSALERYYGKKSLYKRLISRFGLQTKLTWAFILLMTASLASYGFVSIQDTRQKLKDNLTIDAQQASAMLAVLAAELPSDATAAAMRRIVSPFIKAERDVVYVTLLDSERRPMFTESRDGPADVAPDAAAQQPGAVVLANGPHGQHLVSLSPILRKNPAGVAGYVRVGVSLRQYDAQLRQTTDDIINVGLALVLLAIPTAWLIVRRTFQPIRQLVNASQRIAAGELDTRVGIDRSDLIGELARAFNHMVQTITHQQAALRTANQRLHESNRDLEKKIDQRTAQLETANKALNTEIAEKEDFLRAVSHDLNAPLRNISGMVTMLQTKKKDQLDDDAKHRLERIKKNVEVETDLINELLELSRIKTRRGMMEPVNLEQMVWDLRGVFENDLRTRNITLVVDSVLPPLYAERARVRQIFQNLIDNAIKYMGDGPTREIHVGCQIRTSEVEFYVRDTGQGIDPEDIGKVFFVFRRGKNTATQAVSGKGIGLASVKSIVETYAGKIWVESTLGEGTTFRFTINGQHVPLISGRPPEQFDGEKGAEPLAA